MCKAHLFSDTACFREDLRTINDHLEFDRNFKNIYILEPQLKKEKKLTSEASFLDFSIIHVYFLL